MATPRIAPVEPPYDPVLQAAFDRIMHGAEPLLLFRSVARNRRVFERMMAANLLDPGSITLRQRELAILRTCARCNADYEWGVHVAIFGGKAGWEPAQLRSLVRGDAGDACWTVEEQLIIELADCLHERADVDDALWKRLAASFSPEQLIELVMLCGLYHAVSFMVNTLRLPAEKFAARLPAA